MDKHVKIPLASSRGILTAWTGVPNTCCVKDLKLREVTEQQVELGSRQYAPGPWPSPLAAQGAFFFFFFSKPEVPHLVLTRQILAQWIKYRN